ncbi:hypothetical protein ATCC90586_001680 [Pythium insidiosum]|nr:hypothetical protein ATCC90586_001680 [Pythium insidiosum]
MKADLNVISAYVSGKRYKRARTRKQSFSKFAPMFVAHPDERMEHMLWCRVTETAVAREVDRVEAHIRGLRYQKQLPIWQAEQAALRNHHSPGVWFRAIFERRRATMAQPTFVVPLHLQDLELTRGDRVCVNHVHSFEGASADEIVQQLRAVD